MKAGRESRAGRLALCACSARCSLGRGPRVWEEHVKAPKCDARAGPSPAPHPPPHPTHPIPRTHPSPTFVIVEPRWQCAPTSSRFLSALIWSRNHCRWVLRMPNLEPASPVDT
jgi:hypothetical protein